jgi:hypothetical protein
MAGHQCSRSTRFRARRNGTSACLCAKDGRIERRFDVIAAAILASALGALAWALSQIGLVVAAATSIVVPLQLR